MVSKWIRKKADRIIIYPHFPKFLPTFLGSFSKNLSHNQLFADANDMPCGSACKGCDDWL